MHDFYEKVHERLQAQESSNKLGLSTKDAVAENYTESEMEQMVASLKEKPPSIWPAFRLASFIYERVQSRVPEQLRRDAADNLAGYISTPNIKLDDSIACIFIVWGVHRPDHRAICLSLLSNDDASIRWEALSYVGYFLKTDDVPHLLKFHRDPYVSEIAMGGPLRYVLRDQALSLLEKLTKCPVTKGDCFEDTPDGRVSFRSWSPFLNWYHKHR